MESHYYKFTRVRLLRILQSRIQNGRGCVFEILKGLRVLLDNSMQVTPFDWTVIYVLVTLVYTCHV